MIATLPTGRRGRALAVTLTVLVLLVLWAAVAAPLGEFYSDRAQVLEERRTVVAHMDRLAAALPELKQRAEAATRSGPPPSLVLEGSSDAVAGATLQNMIQDMAGARGANLVSVESLPAETTGAYRRIGLKVSLNASWTVLVSLLQSVEQATPPMLIDDLQIHGSPLAMINRATGLEAGFTIYAFRSGTAVEQKP
jgi:general secretion pathway protein M